MADIQTAMRERLAALTPSVVEILDESAAHAGHAGAKSGGHFRVKLVAERFAGLRPVQRHRLVHEALADLLQSGIHALSLVTLTPEENARS